MQLIGHGLGVGVLALIKLHGVPAVLAPPLPVLYYHAGLVALIIKTMGVLQEFLLAVITLAAVNVTERPVRHLRNLTGQVAVSADNLIGRTGKYGVVKCHGYGR